MRATVLTQQMMQPRRLPRLFLVAEFALVLLVPLLAIVGLRSLLSSTEGTIVEQAGPADPGWRAPVDPSPVSAIVIADGDRLAGVAVITQPDSTSPGGGVIIIPPNLVVDDFLVSDRGLNDVALAVELALELHISKSWVVDAAGWIEVFGDTELLIDNPDPVLADDGSILLPVGDVSLSAADTAAFVGRVADDADPLSIIVRQRLWWEAVLASPPANGAGTEIGDLLNQVASGQYGIEVLPYEVDPAGAVRVDVDAVEQLIRDFVPFPTGAELGNRLMVTVLTRTTAVDPASLATAVAGQGIEIVSIGNAGAFDDGPTQLLAPFVLQDKASPLHDAFFLLAEELGADIVWADEFDEGNVVTLVAGPDIRVEF